MDSPLSKRALQGAPKVKCSSLYLLVFVTLLCGAGARRAYGDAALLIEEPYGFFGSINPTGHSAIYLNRVCAETPTKLRRCRPGETGVVISRYSRIQKLDWVAMPVLPYLYAVERVEDVPAWADKNQIQKMQKAYAEDHLQSLVSATSEYDKKYLWPQVLGVAYIRKIYSFKIVTTEEQDDRLIEEYNGKENFSHFNLFTNNCADFSRALLNFYFPTAIHRSITADIAITTPKQVAKSLSAYAKHHDQLELSEIIIPQIPGNYPRSHMNRGVVESLLKTKICSAHRCASTLFAGRHSSHVPYKWPLQDREQGARHPGSRAGAGALERNIPTASRRNAYRGNAYRGNGYRNIDGPDPSANAGPGPGPIECRHCDSGPGLRFASHQASCRCRQNRSHQLTLQSQYRQLKAGTHPGLIEDIREMPLDRLL